MKHVFDCRIIGESNGPAGDAFLGGMIVRKWEEELGQRLARAQFLERENKGQLAIIIALVKKAGGEVRLKEAEIMEMIYRSDYELVTLQDQSSRETVIQVHKIP